VMALAATGGAWLALTAGSWVAARRRPRATHPQMRNRAGQPAA